MSYEYKDLIKTYTEYIMDDYEVVDYIEAGKELNEVYRKAETFDTLLHTYERYRHSHAHDLKLLLGMKAIELLEAYEQKTQVNHKRQDSGY